MCSSRAYLTRSSLSLGSTTMAAPAICVLLVVIMVTSVVCQKKTYIVHMDVSQKPEHHSTHEEWYSDHLQTLLSVDPSTSLLYTYTTALHGFAALLDPHHIHLLRSHPSVLHLHPDPLLHLHTTRSPHFLGLFHQAMSTDSAYLAGTSNNAADVIVGVLDTGVWPESKSFDDSGFTTPPPSRWRGECESRVDFDSSLCNKKIIGARSFSRGFHASSLVDHLSDDANPSQHKHNPKEFESARDRDGHGTHTASTSVGSPVANASLLGYAPGTARGMETGARVAAYKVCWVSGCSGSDILAGIDKAISDGVDILSLSLGGGAVPYYYDTIAIGAFAAMQRGIFVACSAGNSGPKMGTLANTAPWITTVGAGTLDRNFPAYATLGNGMKYTGASLYSGQGMGNKMVPLIYLGESRTTLPASTAASNSRNSSNLCLPGTLDPSRVRGAVVFCDRGINARVAKGAVVKAAGGVGMILANMAANGQELIADSHLLPALSVGAKVGDAIREYAQSDHNPRVILAFGGTVLDVHPSPVVASFSSRGPNRVTPEILKPDVIGPGVNILASWSGSNGPTGLTFDKRKTDFNILSGTSMSCPHISGLAAMLKAAHPKWSPAAIRSALMTTAYSVDKTGAPLQDARKVGTIANPFAYGSGHVNPNKALAPGLVYDITPEDYLSFLCSLNYTMGQIQSLAHQSSVNCNRIISPGNLNYPSFSVVFNRNWESGVTYVRKVTNVDLASVVYFVKVQAPHNARVVVKPRKLVFKHAGQMLEYTVKFNARKIPRNPFSSEFGWITWSDKKHHHHVRSPIAIRWDIY